MPSDVSLEAGYVANKGTKLDELAFYNIPTPGPTATIQARRPFPTWGTALSLDSVRHLQLQLAAGQRHAAQCERGMTILGAYTWAKSIDLSSERGKGDRGGGFDTGGGNVRDRAGYSRGLSGFDVRHRLVVSSVYELPLGRGKALMTNRRARNVSCGRRLGSLRHRAFPERLPDYGRDVRRHQRRRDHRPARFGRAAAIQHAQSELLRRRSAQPGLRHVQHTSFVDLPAGSLRFGSAGRDIVIGPGLVNWDMGVSKNTRFGQDDRFNVQFRWEIFNLFNRANFNQPNRVVNVTSPRFGTITSAGRAREMQFGLKLEF